MVAAKMAIIYNQSFVLIMLFKNKENHAMKNTMRLVRVLIIVVIAAGIGTLYSFLSGPLYSETQPMEVINSTVNCAGEGSIDTATVANGMLTVTGWLIASKKGAVPDKVFVTLTNPHGEITYIETNRTSRPDIKEHFKQPSMPAETGYEAHFNVSELSPGNYIVGMLREYNGARAQCAHVFPIQIIG